MSFPLVKCPVCGGGELIHDTRDIPYEYKGNETLLPAIEGDFCSLCGEVILDMANSKRASSFMGEFNKLHASTTQKV